jgi:hypothetical protein
LLVGTWSRGPLWEMIHFLRFPATSHLSGW